MTDWPANITEFSPFGSFSTAGEGSMLADFMNGIGIAFGTSTTYPAANLAQYFPIIVRRSITVTKLGWQNGSAVSGNLDAGIYDSNQNLLVSAGSTAQAGTSVLQIVNTTDVTLAPGLYYLAIAADTTSGNNLQQSSTVGANVFRACGCAQQASAFPLPNPATFAANVQTRVPLVFGAIQGAII